VTVSLAFGSFCAGWLDRGRAGLKNCDRSWRQMMALGWFDEVPSGGTWKNVLGVEFHF